MTTLFALFTGDALIKISRTIDEIPIIIVYFAIIFQINLKKWESLKMIINDS